MILIRFENLHGKINLSFFSFLLSRFLLSIEGKSKAKSKVRILLEDYRAKPISKKSRVVSNSRFILSNWSRETIFIFIFFFFFATVHTRARPCALLNSL